MKRLILILAFLTATTATVAFAAQQARSVFTSSVTSTVTDGGGLTAAELRTLLTNLADSAFFLSDNDADDVDDTATLHKFVTAADLTNLSNLSGTNTGDQVIPTNVSDLTNDSGYITDYTVTELDVTTHEAALSIADTQITGLTLNDLTFDVGSVSKTEFGYLNGVTSNLQTQIDAIGNSTISWQVSGFIETASEKDYTVILNSEYDITITNITTKSTAGTCTLTGKINATALGGTANSVSSTETSQAHASLNTLTAGDDLIMTISANSACLNVAFTISGTRSTS